MKIVQVTYTTTHEYAPQNQRNIERVMTDLQQLNHPGIHYTACLQADGKTFVHQAFFKSEELQQILNGLASFQQFQLELKSSGLEQAPQQELLSLIGTSKNIFNN
jgi:hypothetical protein